MACSGRDGSLVLVILIPPGLSCWVAPVSTRAGFLAYSALFGSA